MRASSLDRSSKRHALFFISSDTIPDMDRSKLAASFSDEMRWQMILPFIPIAGDILRTQFPSGSTLLHFKKIITDTAATAHAMLFNAKSAIDSRYSLTNTLTEELSILSEPSQKTAFSFKVSCTTFQLSTYVLVLKCLGIPGSVCP
mmetsp:Transcript_44309/g.106743  ORF Transcript_44309/g.106743 Transcript_44309/m.106743 type:complete len:146 (+) Transcript_44309:1956-2393(+)